MELHINLIHTISHFSISFFHSLSAGVQYGFLVPFIPLYPHTWLSSGFSRGGGALACTVSLLCLIYLQLIFLLPSGESCWWRQSPGLWQPIPARTPLNQSWAVTAMPVFHSKCVVDCGGSCGEASTAWHICAEGRMEGKQEFSLRGVCVWSWA